MPLWSLTVWEKLTCKDKPDWPDGPEGPDQTGQRQGGRIDSRGIQIVSATIGYLGAAGDGKWRLPPILSVLQGARSICVSAEK